MAAGEIKHWEIRRRANLSGWIRENPECKIVISNLKILGELPNLTVGEKAEKLIEFLANKYPYPGEEIYNVELNVSSGEFQAVSRAAYRSELDFLMREYLAKEKRFLLQSNQYYQISPAGWAHIDSKRHANPNSMIGFIAMWFNESVNDARLAIEKGISAAGYKPFRVDQKEHNNKIDDEIIAGIRGSKFLVADLTGHRGGVYYEAGFAQGLGLEVIWLCRKSDEEKRHFDIRQYNCIFWEPDKLPELTRALQKRIEASRIGHGPLNEAAAT